MSAAEADDATLSDFLRWWRRTDDWAKRKKKQNR